MPAKRTPTRLLLAYNYCTSYNPRSCCVWLILARSRDLQNATALTCKSNRNLAQPTLVEHRASDARSSVTIGVCS
eukprot:1550122-Pyramimonas_sp.AAC.1